MVVCVLALMCIVTIAPAFSAINVVAASPELADITKQVGGDLVSVYSVAKPNQDYHMLEPRPSDVSRIARADMVVQIGLDLDMWMDALMNAAGNSRVNKGGRGYVDASVGIPLLEVPHKQITGASGDIHVYGNPHYFYDPENGKIVARNIMQGLIRVSPSRRSTFESNYKRFAEEIDRRTAAWQRELAPYKGQSVVIYHDSAVYFIRRFGLRLFGELEPKPGIPPTANHVRDLINRMKEAHVKAMVVESIYPARYPDMVARETGAKSERVPYSVGAMGTRDYFDMIDKWVQGYREALR
jgi:ABC-type Zn uptake system ZnuABC Zn-binding protein ZnuA